MIRKRRTLIEAEATHLRNNIAGVQRRILQNETKPRIREKTRTANRNKLNREVAALTQRLNEVLALHNLPMPIGAGNGNMSSSSDDEDYDGDDYDSDGYDNGFDSYDSDEDYY
eukprot:UN03977